MMQKNLTCKTLRDAQKDMCTYGMAFVPANLLFLFLGILLAILAGGEVTMKGDALLPTYIQSCSDLSPLIAHLLPLFFAIGIVAASFSSADSALTSLTTCFCVDKEDACRHVWILHAVYPVVPTTELHLTD